ncbi:MAG: crossover junction endodeoxyribonuclease RuvC [Thermodesulfovibrionales bacterium]|nr:crossover junction endodeoxyribonuclease RuvC [Thermodesulfovibrionales bacterium]
MKVLGIDPGSINCGYGLLEKDNKKGAIRYIASGKIVISKKKNIFIRIKELYLTLTELFSEFNPDVIVIEKIFFAKSRRVALSLGYTRGVVMLSAAMTNLPIYEYTAVEVKKAIVGYGRADKNQVQKMVQEILSIKYNISTDSADALALALCHLNNKIEVTIKPL